MNRRKFLHLAVTGLAGAACAGPRSIAGRILNQQQGAADFTLRIAPTTVELAPGIVIKTLGFNDSVPGPLIRLKQGVSTSIDVVNHSKSADIVHWHGLAIDPLNDGAMEEGSKMIPSGSALRYTFTPNPGGARWYHTHTSAFVDASHVDVSRGMYSGLFGSLYIERKDNAGAYDHEVFLSVHHWEPTVMHTGEAFTSCPVMYKYATFNGKMLSAAEPLKVKKGDRVLFHFLNASATQNVSIALPHHQFQVIALDGNPVPNPGMVSVLSLAVAERIDAIVEMNMPGVWVLGEINETCRMQGLGLPIEYAGSTGEPMWQEPESNDWAYTRFGRGATNATPDETFTLTFEKIAGKGDVLDRWTINGRSFPDIAPLKVKKGGRYRFVFFNASNEAHPVHIHRHSFELVAIGSKASSGIMKDTINVEPYHKVQVDLVADNEGPTLWHCHHQLHMDYGFMQMIEYI